MTLREIMGEFFELLQMAENEEIDQQIINDTLEGVGCELEEKADAYANIICTLESDKEMLKKEIERLSARAKTLDNNISSMKRNLENAMLITGKKKFKTELHSYSIQKNTPSLQIIDEERIPKSFFIPQEPKLDRRELLKYVKEHQETIDFAEIKQTESLRIR